MYALPYILITIILFSLIFSYLSMISTKNSFDIVRDMGIGYNLGNTFDNYIYDIGKMNTPEEQITINGNSLPTKNMIKKIKKYGFKTIRFPVTWLYFIDDYGNINSDWMFLVKEVVDLIIKENLYCILNMHKDGYYGNWLSLGIESKDKYINLWTQIANEFKDYNNYLIFESMNEVYFYNNRYNYDYDVLLDFNQAFVDTIRNSGGNNIERFLIIAGAYNELDMTSSSEYKIPVDPSNKLALSLHYFEPSLFTREYYFEPYNWTDGNGFIITYEPCLSWGNEVEYLQILTDFELMKNNFVKKGIPVIISEVGVITEERKNLESIREYLYMVFSISSDYDGIMSCLWDSSNKEHGDMNYYDRENDIWYDEKIKENFLQISRGKYIKPKDFYIKTHLETVNNIYSDGNIQLKIGKRKALKIILNVRLTGTLFMDLDFSIYSYNAFGRTFQIKFEKSNGKKQYDGNSIFIIDVNKIKCYDYILVTISYGEKYIILNSLSVEFEESFQSMDVKSYKSAISNYVY